MTNGQPICLCLSTHTGIRYAIYSYMPLYTAIYAIYSYIPLYAIIYRFICYMPLYTAIYAIYSYIPLYTAICHHICYIPLYMLCTLYTAIYDYTTIYSFLSPRPSMVCPMKSGSRSCGLILAHCWAKFFLGTSI